MYKLILLLCFFGIICTQFVTETYADTTIPETEFEDEALYNFLVEMYDTNGNGTLEVEEAESVTSMWINDSVSIQSVKGIKYFKNLTTLNIAMQYGVNDLSEVGQLSELYWLDISCASITSIDFVESLPKLVGLRLLDAGEIQEYSAINSLQNLTELRLTDTGLTDASFIEKCTELTILDISNNTIEIFPDFSKVTKLESLSIYGCGLHEMPDITALNNLVTLNVGQNYLSDADVNGKLPTSILLQDNWQEVIWLNDQIVEEPLPEYEHPGGTITADVEYSISRDFDFATDVYISHKVDEMAKKELGTVELPDIEYDRIFVYDIRVENAETGEVLRGPGKQEEMSFAGYTPIGDEKYYFYQLSEDNVLRSVDGYYENAGDQNLLKKGFNINTDSYDRIVVLVDQKDYSAAVTDEDLEANVEGVFEEDIYVKVEKISDMRPYQEEIDQLYKRVKNIYELNLYDITVYGKVNDELEQPVGKALVSIKMDYNPDYEYTVFRLQDTVWIKLDSYFKDGYLYFESDHFSIFSIVLSEILDKDELEEEQESDNNINEKEEELIDDKIKLYVQIGIVVFAVIAIIAFDIMRRKSNKNCSGR